MSKPSYAQTYSGVCIGGPLDGKSVSHPFRTLTVDMVPPTTHAVCVSTPPTTIRVGAFKYVFVSGFHFGYQPDLNFWVPAKKMPHGLAWVVEQLMAAYIEGTKEKVNVDVDG